MYVCVCVYVYYIYTHMYTCVGVLIVCVNKQTITMPYKSF